MYEKINEDLKNAMKEKDTFKLSVLRMLKSALQLEQIAKKHELDDNEVAAVLKKQVKVRKDSLEEYKKYDKAELVESLEKEVNEAAPFIRGKLSEKLEIRHTPELKFVFDKSIAYGEKIEAIIKSIDKGE